MGQLSQKRPYRPGNRWIGNGGKRDKDRNQEQGKFEPIRIRTQGRRTAVGKLLCRKGDVKTVWIFTAKEQAPRTTPNREEGSAAGQE